MKLLITHTMSGGQMLMNVSDVADITPAFGYTQTTSPAAIAAYEAAQLAFQVASDLLWDVTYVAQDQVIINNFNAAKVTSHAKLVGLGLTSFEATTITGYDPDDDGDGPGDGDGDGDA